MTKNVLDTKTQSVSCCVVLCWSVCFPFPFYIVLCVLQFTKEQVCLRLTFLCGLTNNGFIGIFHGRFVSWGVIALFQSQQHNFASSCPKHFSSWLAIQMIIFYVKGKGHPPMNFDKTHWSTQHYTARYRLKNMNRTHKKTRVNIGSPKRSAVSALQKHRRVNLLKIWS
jgi:hypothetical protein